MGVQLNIKDEETVRLARELAGATGQSLTAAIRQALEQELQRRTVAREATLARVREISGKFRAALPEEWRGKSAPEIIDDLYDEHGLPK